jgi:hypothetical protein
MHEPHVFHDYCDVWLIPVIAAESRYHVGTKCWTAQYATVTEYQENQVDMIRLM